MEKEKKNNNIERLSSFTRYCKAYPELRFWQALRNWAFQEYSDEEQEGEKPEIHKIFAGFDETAYEDTFYWD